MYIVINSRGKTMTSQRHQAIKMTQKMANKGFFQNNSIAFDEQVKEILKWKDKSLEDWDKFLDRH